MVNRNNHVTENPRFDIQQSWWGMMGLGNGTREWTMEEKFEKIAEAGFTGILGRLPHPELAEKWKRLLEAYNFSFGIHSFPYTREDLAKLMREAKELGGVSYVNSQVMDSFVIDQVAVNLLSELLAEAEEQGIPYYVETHRGTITQDLLRTVEYVKAIPNLRLTLDLSHYVLAGEMTEPSRSIEKAFQVLLHRASCIHARVSNGQQIQVDIGTNGGHPMAETYLRWWEQGMYEWLKEADATHTFTFVSELGPPSYSIVKRFDIPTEITDRWEQAVLFQKLARQAWQNASKRITHNA